MIFFWHYCSRNYQNLMKKLPDHQYFQIFQRLIVGWFQNYCYLNFITSWERVCRFHILSMKKNGLRKARKRSYDFINQTTLNALSAMGLWWFALCHIIHLQSFSGLSSRTVPHPPSGEFNPSSGNDKRVDIGAVVTDEAANTPGSSVAIGAEETAPWRGWHFPSRMSTLIGRDELSRGGVSSLEPNLSARFSAEEK